MSKPVFQLSLFLSLVFCHLEKLKYNTCNNYINSKSHDRVVRELSELAGSHQLMGAFEHLIYIYI